MKRVNGQLFVGMLAAFAVLFLLTLLTLLACASLHVSGRADVTPLCIRCLIGANIFSLAAIIWISRFLSRRYRTKDAGTKR